MKFIKNNYFSCRIIYISSLLVFLSSSTLFGQNIFSNPIEGVSPNNFNPYTTGQIINNHINAGGISRGIGISSRNANNRYNAQLWSIGNTASNDKYFEFSLKAKPGFKINFKNFIYTSSRSSDGPNQLILKTSLDTFKNIVATPQILGDTVQLDSSIFQNIIDTIQFRIYGYGASSNLGTFSIDEFKFNGDVIPIITLLPEINSSLFHDALLNYPSTEYQITASNYPTKFNAYGLPLGLNIDTLTGIISGTPTSNLGSPYFVNITASNSAGTATKSLQYTINLSSCSSSEFVKYEFGSTFSSQLPLSYSTTKVNFGNITRNNVFGSVNPLIDNSSPSSSYSGSSGLYNATASCIAGGLNNLSTYFEISVVNHSEYSTIINEIKFGSRSTTTGPTKYVIKTSLDNFSATVAAGDFINNSTWNLFSHHQLSINNSEGGTITFRIYGYNGTGGTSLSNWRIDDLNFQFTLNRKPPAKFNMSTSSSYVCIGTDGTELSLDSSELNVDYQLVRNENILVGEKILGTGTKISLGKQILAGTYSVLASYTITNCIEKMANSITLLETTTNTWLGTLSNNWNDPKNWICNSIPNIQTTEIIIPENTDYVPTLNSDITTYGNINLIDNHSYLNVNNYNLIINGNIYGLGNIIGSDNSSIFFEGSDDDCSIRMNPSSNSSKTLKNLILNRNSNLNLLSPMLIKSKVEINSLQGGINSNGYLTLLSSQDSVSSIGYLSPNAKINGQVNIEIFLRGGNSATARGTRMISFPIKDDLPSPNYVLEQMKNKIFITGQGNTSNNFDLGGQLALNANTIVNYEEIKKETENGFAPISNLLTRVIPSKGYFLFFRGDRINNTFNKLNPPFANPENVILNFKGEINQGEILIPVTYSANNGDNYNGYNAIGNPYPAIINFEHFYSDNSDKIENLISIIKPDRSGQVTMSNGVSTNNNVNEATGNAAPSIKYIQPGQAFYVRVKPGMSGNLIFKESQKQITVQPERLLNKENVANSSSYQSNVNHSIIKLQISDSLTKNESCIVLGKEYSNIYDHFDAINFEGSLLNIASFTSNKIATSINFKELPNDLDTIDLFVNSSKDQENVKLSISKMVNLNEYDIILKDNFMNVSQPISMLPYYFKIIKGIPSTYGDKRFQLIISKKTTLNNRTLNLTLKKYNNHNYLYWNTIESAKIKDYSIFISKDSVNFEFFKKISRESSSFKLFYPLNNLSKDIYVKLMQKNIDNSEIISNIVFIKGLLINNFKYYPNPIVDELNIIYNNHIRDKFYIEFYNDFGQKMYETILSPSINLNMLKPGIINIVIRNLKTKQIIDQQTLIKK